MMEWHEFAVRVSLGALLGAGIGLERQVRQRLAGLRTNALVSIGAAAFVALAALTPGESSPTRVAAQVVSGIGFLGAGVIFREYIRGPFFGSGPRGPGVTCTALGDRGDVARVRGIVKRGQRWGQPRLYW